MNATAATLTQTPSQLDLLLRKALLGKLEKIQDAELTISDPLGQCVLGRVGADGLRASIQVHDVSFYRQISLGGSIGAAEAYMDQLWQAE